MPALDFTEISAAHVPDGSQDSFEFLARDFFEAMGFEVESGPDRGQDDGRDLLLLERREGPLGTTERRWLVSCKHKAHSGQSVRVSDEEDIRDRVRSHGAEGFIGFYSTVMSSSLARKLERLKSEELEVKVFDPEAIEAALLSKLEGMAVAKRYFRVSYNVWESYGSGPANFLAEYEPLTCVACGRDLLAEDVSSKHEAVVVWVNKDTEDFSVTHYVDFYWACKGKCDRKLKNGYSDDYSTKWEEMTDILIPTNYVKWHIAIMNAIYDGKAVYNRSSFERIKEFTILIAQLVVRNQSEAQDKRLARLSELPPGL